MFGRDLPLLGAVVGRPMQVALLKGRSNYLCWHRLDAAAHDGTRDAATLAALRALDAWGQTSDTGDLTELEDSPTISRCARRSRRPSTTAWEGTASSSIAASLLEARRRAQAADVVIVNHHLLLADLALKDSGFGELLPGTDAVIVDEAHQLPDVAQQFFGWSVSTRELESLVRDAVRRGARRRRLGASRRGAERARPRDRRAACRRPRGPKGGRRGSPRPRRCATRCPEAAERLEALGRRRSSRSRKRAPALRNCLERCAVVRSAAARDHGRRSERRACAGSISPPAPSRCTGRRSTSAPRSRRASRRRTESGCSRPRRSPSARTSRISCAASVCTRRLTGRAAEPVRLRAQRADLRAAGLAGPRATSTTSRRLLATDLAARRSGARRGVSAVHELSRAAARRALARRARGVPGACSSKAAARAASC